MWHVSSRSSVATLRTAIHLSLTYLLEVYHLKINFQFVLWIYTMLDFTVTPCAGEAVTEDDDDTELGDEWIGGVRARHMFYNSTAYGGVMCGAPEPPTGHAKKFPSRSGLWTFRSRNETAYSDFRTLERTECRKRVTICNKLKMIFADRKLFQHLLLMRIF